LREYLDIFVFIYLDNILIFLEEEEEYKVYIYTILERLAKNQIYFNIRKYEFYIKEIHFLGFVIKPGKIKIKLEKVQ